MRDFFAYVNKSTEKKVHQIEWRHLGKSEPICALPNQRNESQEFITLTEIVSLPWIIVSPDTKLNKCVPYWIIWWRKVCCMQSKIGKRLASDRKSAQLGTPLWWCIRWSSSWQPLSHSDIMYLMHVGKTEKETWIGSSQKSFNFFVSFAKKKCFILVLCIAFESAALCDIELLHVASVIGCHKKNRMVNLSSKPLSLCVNLPLILKRILSE